MNLTTSKVHFSGPVLSGHSPIPQGCLLNTGFTVLSPRRSHKTNNYDLVGVFVNLKASMSFMWKAWVDFGC